MMMYSGVNGYSGSLRCFDYVHILRVTFTHESVVYSIFFFDVVSEGCAVSLYILLCLFLY